uniref:Uncharacterized protein n=1 Tax=viral metagenome TaxID=1070528 RepID=A0A6M3LP99_9ZZZZ
MTHIIKEENFQNYTYEDILAFDSTSKKKLVMFIIPLKSYIRFMVYKGEECKATVKNLSVAIPIYNKLEE